MSRLTEFLKTHIIGIAIFSIITGVAGNFVYDRLKAKSESSRRVDIGGPWNTEHAKELVSRTMELADWSKIMGDSLGNAEPEHVWLGEYHLPYATREVILAIVASHGETCHACTAHLSMFEFEKENLGWTLVSSSLGAIETGTYGEIEAKDVRVEVVGRDLYGVLLTVHDMAMGFEGTFTSVFVRVGDSFRRVLNLETAEDNRGSRIPPIVVSRTTIMIRPGQTGFFDLQVTRKGTRDSSPFVQTSVWRFNGREYEESTVFK